MTSDLLEVDAMAHPDEASGRAVAERARKVLRPTDALRRLDELAVWLAHWQRTTHPAIDRPVALVFGGDHGVTEERVSAYPASVTCAMMEALTKGSATAAVMARHLGVTLEAVDVGVGESTGNIRVEPALSEDQFEHVIRVGREAVSSAAADLLVLGEIGIGNTTPAAAICLALFGGAAEDWAGPGTGLDADGVARKASVVSDAVTRVSESDPMQILRELGGWELAAIAGAVIEARQRSIPVLLDGFVVTASVMPLGVFHPGYLDHCWPAHVSAEPGHRQVIEMLGRRPILDLEMRLGEGSGALAALPIVGLAARSVVEVATFEEWGLA